MKYAEILLPNQIGSNIVTLTYQIPENTEEQYQIGQLVEIPLRNKSVKGIIYNIQTVKPKFNTREITKIVANAPHLSTWQIELLNWISNYYFAPLSKTLRLFLPSSITKKKKLTVTGPLEETSMELKFKHALNLEQKSALKTIKNTPKTVCLLHGITGSGKTEIYMHTVEESLKAKKQVLILIPEIALTPQTQQRFADHFNEKAVAIHSQLTPKQKELAWQSIYKGEAKIIIGSRSALFAPFQNLSHIIIDEEHDACYKQDQSPRYNAIDVAIKMAELLGIKVLMGSATPSLESYHKAKTGQYELIELIERPTKENLSLPKAKIIDLRDEIKRKNFSIFSEILQVKLQEKLEQKEQIILFLNRRGAASAVICRACGFIANCPNCEIPMTYHRKITVEDGIHSAERLVCHHCGILKKVPSTCPECNSHYIKFIGLGTQRVEEEIQKLHPNAKVLRADRDTTGKRDQFKAIYESFKNNKADILIGTQMIAIGLHLPKVNLVGIVMADTGLTIPNFRSSERTFQIITQVSGRAGREKEGQAIIQTYLPNHYAIVCAAAHDYQGFYQKEISLRKEMKNPPFSNLIKLTFKDPINKKAMQKSLAIFNELEKANQNAADSSSNPPCDINHYPALIPRLQNQYRWQILLNGVGAAPANLIRSLKNLEGAIIDVDPLSTV